MSSESLGLQKRASTVEELANIEAEERAELQKMLVQDKESL